MKDEKLIGSKRTTNRSRGKEEKSDDPDALPITPAFAALNSTIKKKQDSKLAYADGTVPPSADALSGRQSGFDVTKHQDKLSHDGGTYPPPASGIVTRRSNAPPGLQTMPSTTLDSIDASHLVNDHERSSLSRSMQEGEGAEAPLAEVISDADCSPGRPSVRRRRLLLFGALALIVVAPAVAVTVALVVTKQSAGTPTMSVEYIATWIVGLNGDVAFPMEESHFEVKCLNGGLFQHAFTELYTPTCETNDFGMNCSQQPLQQILSELEAGLGVEIHFFCRGSNEDQLVGQAKVAPFHYNVSQSSEALVLLSQVELYAMNKVTSQQEVDSRCSIRRNIADGTPLCFYRIEYNKECESSSGCELILSEISAVQMTPVNETFVTMDFN